MLSFPFQFTFDSKRNRKIDVLINEGPVRLTPIYTITVQTGPISRCSNVDVKIALIGEGASTLPFELFSDEFSNRKEVFQSGSRDRFEISPFETSDVGQVRRKPKDFSLRNVRRHDQLDVCYRSKTVEWRSESVDSKTF